MQEHDLALLAEAARSAGDIALSFWTGSNEVWEKGPDDPVSEADLAVDGHFRQVLLGARPDYGWLSEETEDTPERLSRSRVFIVDPIDGTRAFINGQKSWAHSIAVVEDGVPVAGVVFLPAIDKLYAAARGQRAELNGTPIQTAESNGARDTLEVLSNKAALDPSYWPGGMPRVERTFRPSLAYRLCLVADGQFDAMVTFRDSWEWDIAAGSLIVECAGGTVTDRMGAPVRYNAASPKAPGIIAGSGRAHTQLMAARRPT